MANLTGQIGITTRADSWVQRGIELVTRSEVHHVVVAVSETKCISAQPGGAVITPIDYRDDIMWSQFDLTPEQAQACADWARAREGRPYNFINGALIGIYCLFRMPLPDFITDRFITDDSYQCAQLADAALTQGAGIDVFTDDRYPGGVYPGSFGRLFKSRGWWIDPKGHPWYA